MILFTAHNYHFITDGLVMSASKLTEVHIAGHKCFSKYCGAILNCNFRKNFSENERIMIFSTGGNNFN